MTKKTQYPSQKRGPTPKGLNEQYPMDRWLNGQKHQLVRGKDYNSLTSSFSVYLRQVAIKRKKKISINALDEGVLQIQAFPK